LVLAVLAYWITGWGPGLIYIDFLGWWHTDAGVVYELLLMLTVLAYGAALRAKVILVRYLASETSSHQLQRARGAARPGR